MGFLIQNRRPSLDAQMALHFFKDFFKANPLQNDTNKYKEVGEVIYGHVL